MSFDPNWLWLIPVVGFFLFEFLALRSDTDKLRPLTYWVRKTFHLDGGLSRKVHSIGWWVAAAILGWLVFHFLLESA